MASIHGRSDEHDLKMYVIKSCRPMLREHGGNFDFLTWFASILAENFTQYCKHILEWTSATCSSRFLKAPVKMFTFNANNWMGLRSFCGRFDSSRSPTCPTNPLAALMRSKRCVLPQDSPVFAFQNTETTLCRKSSSFYVWYQVNDCRAATFLQSTRSG